MFNNCPFTKNLNGLDQKILQIYNYLRSAHSAECKNLLNNNSLYFFCVDAILVQVKAWDPINTFKTLEMHLHFDFEMCLTTFLQEPFII